MTKPTVHVEARGLSKTFGGIGALSDINISVARGEVHAFVGQNGAGKSTLGRIIAGVYAHDEGELLVSGRPVDYGSPRDALRDGIAIIQQELALVPPRTVLENVLLGREVTRWGRVDRRALRQRFDELNRASGFALDPDARVDALSIAAQQKVESLRALSREAELIIMDEPTAVLGRDGIHRVRDLVLGLRARGTTVIYVSHFVDEVLSLADTVTVLRDGGVVASTPASEETPESLVTRMLGRRLDLTFPPKQPPAEGSPVVLSVSGLFGAGATGEALELRAGEIVGVAGLVGSGRSSLLHKIFGSSPRGDVSVRVGGQEVKGARPGIAMRHGLSLLPESRRDQGLVTSRTIGENIALPQLGSVSSAGLLKKNREAELVSDLTERVGIRSLKPTVPVEALSGGNQQKVLFAKCLAQRPRVLLADEPTRGVDVGSKRAIYELIHGLAASGTAVVLVSSELEELRGLSHRLLVVHRGRRVAEFDGDAPEEQLVTAVFDANGGEGLVE